MRQSCLNAVSRNNFSCEVREWHHVCENLGGNCPVCPFLDAALIGTKTDVKTDSFAVFITKLPFYDNTIECSALK